MANLSVRRVDDEVVEKLKQHARRESVSMEEKVRRILADAVAPDESLAEMLRRVFINNGALGDPDDGVDLVLEPPEFDEPIDFSGPEYGDDDR